MKTEAIDSTHGRHNPSSAGLVDGIQYKMRRKLVKINGADIHDKSGRKSW